MVVDVLEEVDEVRGVRLVVPPDELAAGHDERIRSPAVGCRGRASNRNQGNGVGVGGPRIVIGGSDRDDPEQPEQGQRKDDCCDRRADARPHAPQTQRWSSSAGFPDPEHCDTNGGAGGRAPIVLSGGPISSAGWTSSAAGATTAWPRRQFRRAMRARWGSPESPSPSDWLTVSSARPVHSMLRRSRLRRVPRSSTETVRWTGRGGATVTPDWGPRTGPPRLPPKASGSASGKALRSGVSSV